MPSVVEKSPSLRTRVIFLGYVSWLAVALSAAPALAQSVAYVLLSNGTVAILDRETDTVMDTVSVGREFNDVTLTPDGAYLYIVGGVNPGYLWILDTATYTVSDTLIIGQRPLGVAITPDGRFAYVTSYYNTVSVLDTATHQVVDRVEVREPGGLAITPDGAYVYVASYDGPLVVIDTATHAVVDMIAVNTGQHPRRVGITPDGAYAYVLTVNTVAVLDMATRTRVTTILASSSSFPWSSHIVFHPDGTYAYMSDAISNRIWVFDLATHTLADRWAIPDAAGLALTADGAYLYACETYFQRLTVLDTATAKTVATIPIAPGPSLIVIPAWKP